MLLRMIMPSKPSISRSHASGAKAGVVTRRSNRRSNHVDPLVKREISTSSRPSKLRKVERSSPPETPLKAVPDDIKPDIGSTSKTTASPKTLRERKAASLQKYASDSPFPSFLRPHADECTLARKLLEEIHGVRKRPAEVKASANRAGCGDSPAVLDALVRTILSQNTSDTNSSRAKRSMDDAYGRSDDWEAIVKGGQSRLEEAIRCGGLSQVKSKVIIRILEQTKDKYGSYSLDHLQSASTEQAMGELLGFDGVGPKTASCVLLFCLGREDFAVDTHVHRLTGLLGWRPPKANRDQTYHHLNKRIPDEHKYALHVLFVTHGKRCDECKAGGRSTGKCALRSAFREKVKGEGREQEAVKEEPLAKMEDTKSQI